MNQRLRPADAGPAAGPTLVAATHAVAAAPVAAGASAPISAIAAAARPAVSAIAASATVSPIAPVAATSAAAISTIAATIAAPVAAPIPSVAAAVVARTAIVATRLVVVERGMEVFRRRFEAARRLELGDLDAFDLVAEIFDAVLGADRLDLVVDDPARFDRRIDVGVSDGIGDPVQATASSSTETIFSSMISSIGSDSIAGSRSNSS